MGWWRSCWATGAAKIEQHCEADIGANVASGSYRSDGMIVLPCTMGTLAGIANGMASNLIERAADVCLKEGRRLVLCVRETPFNRIHLRNMQLASDAGATIFPVMPAMYNAAQGHDRDGAAVCGPGAGAYRAGAGGGVRVGRSHAPLELRVVLPLVGTGLCLSDDGCYGVLRNWMVSASAAGGTLSAREVERQTTI